jgi:hypothetical protein
MITAYYLWKNISATNLVWMSGTFKRDRIRWQAVLIKDTKTCSTSTYSWKLKINTNPFSRLIDIRITTSGVSANKKGGRDIVVKIKKKNIQPVHSFTKCRPISHVLNFSCDNFLLGKTREYRGLNVLIFNHIILEKFMAKRDGKMLTK